MHLGPIQDNSLFVQWISIYSNINIINLVTSQNVKHLNIWYIFHFFHGLKNVKIYALFRESFMEKILLLLHVYCPKRLNMYKKEIQKWQIFWTIKIFLNKPDLIDVSSNEYCRHIHQTEALIKIFLLCVVSHSGIFWGNLRL